MDDIHEKMNAIAGGDEVYTTKRLRQKLEEHYGDHIFFAKIGGSRKTSFAFAIWRISS